MDDEKLEELGREIVDRLLKAVKPYSLKEAQSIVGYVIGELSILSDSLRADIKREGRPNG